MSTVLQGEKQVISEEQLISQLVKSPLLSQFLRALLVEKEIASIDYLPAELDEIRKQLKASPKLTKLSPQQLETLAIQTVKVEKFKRLTWKNQIQAYFVNHKLQWDRVIYSVIRTSSVQATQEIYFRLQEEEASFAELARQYSQGTEAQKQGKIGPIELGLIHPNIAKVLRGSQVGQVSPLIQINQWFAIVQLEKFIPAQLTEKICQQILDQLFENWLQEKVYQEVKHLEFLTNQQKQQVKVPVIGMRENSNLASLMNPTLYPLRAKEEFEGGSMENQEDFETNLSSVPVESWKSEQSTTVTQEKLYQKLRTLLRKHSQSAILKSLMVLIVPLGFGGLSWKQATVQPNPVNINSGKEKFRQGINHATQASNLAQSARSQGEWNQVVSHWQNAIASMTIVPPEYSQSVTAQQKVVEYQKYLNYAQKQANSLSDSFREAINHANKASHLLKVAQSSEDWDRISQHWKQAIALMSIVAPEHPQYEIARQKMIEYQRYLNYSYTKAIKN